jgi:hypothetical protein
MSPQAWRSWSLSANDDNGDDEQFTLRILAGFINVAEEFLYHSCVMFSGRAALPAAFRRV